MERLEAGLRVGCVATLLALSWVAQAQAPLARPEDVGLSSARLALIHDAVRIQVDAGQIPGAIVLVARDGKVVYFEAQGDTHPGSGVPLQTGQILGAGSLTKALVSVAAMMLVEEGKLGLDDPVSRYITEFGAPRQVRVLEPGSPPAPYNAMPGPPPKSEWGEPRYALVPAAKPITVRMLLEHTSGMQVYGIDNAFPRPGPTDTLAGFVPKLAGVALEYQPGSRWAYSNSVGYEVLARVIEVASGMDLRQFLQRRLLGPLGMDDTDMGVKRSSLACGVPYAPGIPLTVAGDTTYFSGSAGLWTTVGDYSLFVRMLANDGSYNGRQYLKPDTVRQMAANQIGPFVIGGYPPLGMPGEGLKFGLGLMSVTLPEVAGTRLPAGSFGWNGDGTRLFWVVPEQHIVILSMLPTVGPLAAPMQRSIEAIVMGSIITPTR